MYTLALAFLFPSPYIFFSFHNCGCYDRQMRTMSKNQFLFNWFVKKAMIHLLVTATCRFAFPSSTTSMTSSGLDTNRSVAPCEWQRQRYTTAQLNQTLTTNPACTATTATLGTSHRPDDKTFASKSHRAHGNISTTYSSNVVEILITATCPTVSLIQAESSLFRVPYWSASRKMEFCIFYYQINHPQLRRCWGQDGNPACKKLGCL